MQTSGAADLELLRVDDANNLAASLLLLALRGGCVATSCEKTIRRRRVGWMRCGLNLDAGDGLLQGLSVHKKEGGWQ